MGAETLETTMEAGVVTSTMVMVMAMTMEVIIEETTMEIRTVSNK